MTWEEDVVDPYEVMDQLCPQETPYRQDDGDGEPHLWLWIIGIYWRQYNVQPIFGAWN